MSRDWLIRRLYEIGALKFGEFTLKSGKKSPYYIDLRILPSHPDVLIEVAKALKAIIAKQRQKPSVLCGIPMAGLAIANALSIETGIPVVYTRKEPMFYRDLARHFRRFILEGKYLPEEVPIVEKVIATLEEFSGFKIHGIANYLDGEIRDGDKIAIVDDLITTADSKIEARDLIMLEARRRNIKVNVLWVYVVLDREQGGKEILEKEGIRLYSVLTITEVAKKLHENGILPTEKYEVIIRYTASEKMRYK
ncbi:MAG: phosphoribosyltransferase family protein [Candidatus Micrarchaeia archaeon]